MTTRYKDTVCIIYPGDLSEPHGGSRRVLAFVRGLLDAGFDVHIVASKPKSFLEDPDLDAHIYFGRYIAKDSDVLNQLRRSVDLVRIAKEIYRKHNGSMYVQIEHSHLAGLAFLFGNFRDYIVDMHDLVFAGPVYSKNSILRSVIKRIEAIGLANASKVIVVSEPMKKFIVDNFGIYKDIFCIPNGYAPKKIIEPRSELCDSVVFLGSLHLKIDYDKIVYLAKAIQDISIDVIGDGPGRFYLFKKVKEFSLNNIHIWGRLPDDKAYSLIARAKVAIYPIKPTFGYHTKILTSVKLFDYAIFGKAIVLDDVSESEVWKKFKECGGAVFSDPRNPDDFVNNVENLLQNPRLRRRLGYRAFKLAYDFSWTELGKKIANVYGR